MVRTLIATRNGHKAAEIQAVLGPRLGCLTLLEAPSAPEVVEDADSFAGNAAKKAQTLARWLEQRLAATDCPVQLVLADDSGLCVDALGGAPGVRSARFAVEGRPGGTNAPDVANNAKLLRLLAGVPSEQRTARFRCVIALARVEPGGTGRTLAPGLGALAPLELYEGVCEGRILDAPRGQGGFGYDPLFVPDGLTESFAEAGESVKNRISHRARALIRLRERLTAAGVL
jgi:XTP/dITP diphosphohydrolase